MKRKYVRLLALFLAAGMLLEHPVAVYAAETKESLIIEENVVTEEDTVTEESKITEESAITEEKYDNVSKSGTDKLAEEKEDEELLDTVSGAVPLMEEKEEITAKNGVWNVCDFGAGKGGDDTYAINQALSSVTAGAETVQIPSGTYNLVGWLNVPANAIIKFEDGANIKGNGACGGFLIQGNGVRIEKPSITNVSIGIKASDISDLHITGGNIKPVSSGVGIELHNTSGAEIDGITLTSSKLGIFAVGGSNLQIKNSTVTDQSQGGIWSQGGTNGITLTSNTVKLAKTAGVWLDGAKNVTINSNNIQENGNSAVQTTYGIKLLGSCDNVVIQNNTISDNQKDGINISENSTGVKVNSNTIQRNRAIGVCVGSGSSVEVSNNRVEQNQDHGIILISSYGTIKDNTIDGNGSVGNVARADHYGIIIFCRNAGDKNNVIEVSNNKVSGMVGNGIQVTGDKANPNNEGAINVLVSGNQISNVGDHGITVNYNSHNAQIIGNTITNAKTNGIDIQGGSKNCKVSNNTIENVGNMGISIGAEATGADVDITGNKVNASKNVGIHVTNNATTATVSDNKVTNHSGNFSIAIVNGAKAALKQNTVIMPLNYIVNHTNVAQYAIFVGDGTVTTNGAAKFNFKPEIPNTGATAFTGSGTPGLTAVLDLNGSEKNTVIDKYWKYNISCNALKGSDTYQISAKDAYGNIITYTNGTISNDVDETKVRAFVERMYTVALNRPADEKGCTYWVNQLVTGAKDGATVAKGFVLSKEMENRKLDNDQYIIMLYRTFFDRSPSANDSGKAFWINLLENGVSRAYVFRGFCHSQEFTNICTSYGITRGNITLTESRDQNHNITMYVFRCYNRTLGRTPDKDGLNFWTGQIQSKKRTPIDVAGNFVFSTEFKNKKLSDTEYVKVLYRMFFDREYNAPGTDPNGINFWLEELKSGRRDRYKVFLGFANSKEFEIVLKQFGL